MPEYTVRTNQPRHNTFDIGPAKDVWAAGWRFRNKLPSGADPRARVVWVSRTGHNSWFRWPGDLLSGADVVKAKITYEHGGELFTETLLCEGFDESSVRANALQGCKTIRRIDIVPERRNGLTDEQAEALESFIERWNEGG